MLAAGNSNGDHQMLQYVSENNPNGKSLELLIHLDDPKHEFSYNKGADKIWEEAKNQNWNILSMKNDFIRIFPFKDTIK